MRRSLLAIAILLLLTHGCGKASLEEPQGMAVALTQQETDYATRTSKYPQWFAWQTKGVQLANDGSYDEALFCFNEAMKVWPKADPDSKTKHLPEPTDTLLQKASLYLKINKPELALHYYEKFESHIPGSKIAQDGKKKAREMLGKKDK